MAELADALDLGSSAQKACRFKSCSRHQSEVGYSSGIHHRPCRGGCPHLPGGASLRKTFGELGSPIRPLRLRSGQALGVRAYMFTARLSDPLALRINCFGALRFHTTLARASAAIRGRLR